MKFPFSRKVANSHHGSMVVSPARPPVDLAAEFRCLWTAAQFFAVLQRLQLPPERGAPVDLAPVGRQLEEVQQLKRSVAASKLVQVQRGLAEARVEIYALDETIPVPIMRAFFERLGRFDRAALGEVVRYFLTKPTKTQEDRDKLDLLVTRFGSYRVESQTEYATWRSVDALTEQLDRLHPHIDDFSAANSGRILDDLREMRQIIFDIRAFGDLVERKVVTRLHDYKVGLGEAFYLPTVLAETVETNVAVHNKFQELYHTEMLRLRLEGDRLSRLQEDTALLLPALESHHALTELGAMTLQMQKLLQEVKKDVADIVIVDRDARISVEEAGVPLRTLVESCEEALRHASDLVKSLHNAFRKADAKTGASSGP
jgi:hypothetical protein